MLKSALLRGIETRLEEAEKALRVLDELYDFRVMSWGKYYTAGDLAKAIKHMRTQVELERKALERRKRNERENTRTAEGRLEKPEGDKPRNGPVGEGGEGDAGGARR